MKWAAVSANPASLAQNWQSALRCDFRRKALALGPDHEIRFAKGPRPFPEEALGPRGRSHRDNVQIAMNLPMLKSVVQDHHVDSTAGSLFCLSKSTQSIGTNADPGVRREITKKRRLVPALKRAR